ncbi:uncharacterized protein LOC113349408 [Papaver somniferum]|uniref:uncharacterized protein LOC113349408 n=1 Tax=Papaver somniferum TaxID=3469 RepID=UPI000E6F7A81|nr:uncharacterized protein LOC113349408 [Papaver somniferum]
MCTMKCNLNVQKRAFLAEQVSSIITHKTPPEYKDPGCPNIACTIGKHKIEHTYVGASVNLLPYFVYEQLGLGDLKPTNVTLQLADRSIKIPRGVVEDILVQVDSFVYPVDFIILDTQPVADPSGQIPIILGRPFLATANAIIKCRNGIMELTFGSWKMEVNVFIVARSPPDFNDHETVCMIDEIVHDTFLQNHLEDPLQACLTHFGEDITDDSVICEVNALLESTPLLDTSSKWKPKIEPFVLSESRLVPSVEKAPTLTLKTLPDTLKYVYLGSENTLPVIIASNLTLEQESKLVNVLREHRTTIGWSIIDLKGISPSDCMYHIYLEENSKTSREMQRRLNPNMKEVVREEVLKMLDAGIIYPISDSTWVSPVQVVPEKSGITVVKNKHNELIPTGRPPGGVYALTIGD